MKRMLRMQPNRLVVGLPTMYHQNVPGPQPFLEVSFHPRPIPKSPSLHNLYPKPLSESPLVPFIHSFFHAHAHYIIHLYVYSFIQILHSRYQNLILRYLFIHLLVVSIIIIIVSFQFSSLTFKIHILIV